VADRHGTGASKTTRAALAGLFRYAVEHGVLSGNALRQVRAVRSQVPKKSRIDHARAFTREERDRIVAYADPRIPDPLTKPHPRSMQLARAAADLTVLLAGTGMRIE
jgi:integrase